MGSTLWLMDIIWQDDDDERSGLREACVCVCLFVRFLDFEAARYFFIFLILLLRSPSVCMSSVYEREPSLETLIFEFLVLKSVYPPIFSVIWSFLVFSHILSVCLSVCLSSVFEREPSLDTLIFEFLVLKLVYPPIFSVIWSFLVFFAYFVCLSVCMSVCMYVRFWERTESRDLNFWIPRPKISLPSDF